MEVQELRIGNLVTTVEGTKHFGKELRVEFLTDNNCYDLDAPLDSINGYELNKVIPIPLTEEWLVRFGFEKVYQIFSGDNIKFYELNGMSISKYDLREKTYCVNTKFKAPIKHVHHLQNLYFTLTGEELELTEK